MSTLLSNAKNHVASNKLLNFFQYGLNAYNSIDTFGDYVTMKMSFESITLICVSLINFLILSLTPLGNDYMILLLCLDEAFILCFSLQNSVWSFQKTVKFSIFSILFYFLYTCKCLYDNSGSDLFVKISLLCYCLCLALFRITFIYIHLMFKMEFANTRKIKVN